MLSWSYTQSLFAGIEEQLRRLAEVEFLQEEALLTAQAEDEVERLLRGGA